MARPKAQGVTVKGTFAAARIGCPQDEAAAIMGVSEATFKRRLASDPLIREAWLAGAAAKRAYLRQRQFQMILGSGPGAASMLLHLSAHHLGETQRSVVDHTGTVTHVMEHRSSVNSFVDGIDPRRFTAEQNVEFGELVEEIEALGGSPVKLSNDKWRRFNELIDIARIPDAGQLALPPPERDNDLYDELNREEPPASDPSNEIRDAD
jgi:hypothetical protein